MHTKHSPTAARRAVVHTYSSMWCFVNKFSDSSSVSPSYVVLYPIISRIEVQLR